MRAAVVLSLLCATAACADSGSSLERARDVGLRAGFAIEAPYAGVDSAGDVTGEAVETLRHVTGIAGITAIQWIPLEFPALIPALRAKRIDVIAAGMFVTVDRAELVRFSRPTVCVRPALVVRAAPPFGERRAAVLERCTPCRIAVIQGSVEHAALDYADLDDSTVVVPDMATGVAAVRSGAADAVAISAPTARLLTGTDPTLTMAPYPPSDPLAQAAAGCAAFAFRFEDEELAAAIDRALDEFLGSAEHRALARKFGFGDDELP